MPKEVINYLTPDDYIPAWKDNTLYLLPPEVQTIYPLLQEKLHILTAGVEIGELKGKDLIPAQSLALSTRLNRNVFPEVEVDWNQAIAYLRKETLTLSETTPKGYALLTYRDRPIGFVKHLGNRANNLYPQEWRIRSSYIPEEVKLPE